jgi:hypothetical protein
MSTTRAYQRPAPQPARAGMAGEWGMRAAIVLAIFFGALALGRLTAQAGGGGEAAPPAVFSGPASAVEIPTQLAGAPPLERALSERAAREGAEAAPTPPPAHTRTSAPAGAATATGTGEAARLAAEGTTQASTPATTVSTPAPASPRKAPAKPAPRHSSAGGSSGAGSSFDSLG